ncbi:FAS1 domain-containing protein [Plasmodiophora brassicae]|nr:hypothetical protein PBRA_006101 [Plasmodiophora brassicae]
MTCVAMITTMLLVLAAGVQSSDSNQSSQGNDFVTVAMGTTEIKSFISTLNASGVLTDLYLPGEYTVLAPNDEAFANATLPTNATDLAKLMRYHIIHGKHAMSALNGTFPTMDDGNEVSTNPISVLGLTVVAVNDANIVDGDHYFDYGVIQILSKVLDPAGGPAAAPESSNSTSSPSDSPAGQQGFDTSSAPDDQPASSAPSQDQGQAGDSGDPSAGEQDPQGQPPDNSDQTSDDLPQQQDALTQTTQAPSYFATEPSQAAPIFQAQAPSASDGSLYQQAPASYDRSPYQQQPLFPDRQPQGNYYTGQGALQQTYPAARSAYFRNPRPYMPFSRQQQQQPQQRQQPPGTHQLPLLGASSMSPTQFAPGASSYRRNPLQMSPVY